MRKTILSIAAMLLCCFSLSAQTDGETWWGYCDASDFELLRSGSAETADFAIYLPAAKYGLRGHTIEGIRFYVPNSTAVENVSVWMATTRPTDVSKANVAYKPLALSDLALGEMNEVRFDKPYTINTASVYIGYSFTTTDKTVSNIAAVDPVGDVNSCWTRFSVFSGNTWSTQFYSTFAVAVSVLFGGDWEEGVRVTGADYLTALAGTTGSVGLSLENGAPSGLRSIDYTVTDDEGNVGEEQHLDLAEPVHAMGDARVELPIAAGDALGFHKPVVTVTKVNGKENAAAERYQTATLDQLVIAEKAETKRVVEEEFTGMWCGWCPRGMVGMEQAEKTFGDRFIGIAVHYQDDLAATSGYGSFISSNIKGYPSCLLNRNTLGVVDPYYGSDAENTKPFSIASDITDELERPAEADVDAVAAWANEAHTRISVTSKVTFHMDNASAPYAVAYVLVSDSLKNSSWVQTNYLSEYNLLLDDEYLSPWVKKSEHVSDLYYNHVAITSNSVASGASNSIKAPIENGVEQRHTVTLSMPTSKLLVSKESNLHVVAMLINRTRKCIVNAVKVPVTESVGIKTVESVASDTAAPCYDLQGRRVTTPRRGIYIQQGKKYLR